MEVQIFGIKKSPDTRFLDLGLGAARLSGDRWLEKLVEQPLMLRMPLCGTAPS